MTDPAAGLAFLGTLLAAAAGEENEHRLAATGHVHALFYNKLMPWGHAAGWLLHREAGGCSGHFDGSGYLASHTSGGLVCVPDPHSFDQVRAALLGSCFFSRWSMVPSLHGDPVMNRATLVKMAVL